MADKQLSGIKVLMIIAPEQFRDEELLEPKQILTDAGAQVTVASTIPGQAHGMLGATVQPDAHVDSLKASDFNGIIVVGGMGSPEYLWQNSTVHNLLRQCHQDGKLVAGICLSGAVLANAGVLNGKRATVWATPESLAALKNGHAQYVQEHVVADGHVITADGPEAAAEFAKQLTAVLRQSAAKV